MLTLLNVTYLRRLITEPSWLMMQLYEKEVMKIKP